MSSNDTQRGAVSIFVVIFAALLMTIVTVSFIRIMLQDQDQSTRNDLSQSAYDSAQAGVEDAKRAMLRYVRACSAAGTATDCINATKAVNSTQCNEIVRIGDVVGASTEGDKSTGYGEIRIQQTEGDKALDQAYTCVTAQMVTDDYLGEASANGSVLVPLKTEAGQEFNTVTIEWFSREDLGGSDSDGIVDLKNGIDSPMPLYQTSSWPVNRPALMRAQLMQTGSSFSLADFDAPKDGKSNANTVFLYPTRAPVSPAMNIPIEFLGRDGRTNDEGSTAASPNNAPYPVYCQSIPDGGYACKMDMILPDPVGAAANDRKAYVRLTPLYNGAHFRVTISMNGSPRKIDGVQPIVDSTGRANDIFRRVVSRVNLADDFPYPDAAVDVMGNLCKSFSVTDTTYYPGTGDGVCTP